MKPTVIVGAGGHGRVVLDILRAMRRRVAGFLDEGRDRDSGLVNGAPMLGGSALLASREFLARHDVLVAIGDNAARRRLVETVLSNEGTLATAIHPACVISPTAAIGEGTVIVPGAVVNANARIGRFCIVNTGATIGHDVVLEDGAQVAPGANMGGGSYCEADAFVAIGAVVAPKVRIGAGATLGAGATAVRDIPPRVVALGTPARWRDA